ncbi:MAG: succinylglutamate desuccinylase/aspartoacylase family protein [Fulvivirga sp.]|nr:succinylglutamate desuccinylase/aspartoacylase family protein [Fulvivirga sp.]
MVKVTHKKLGESTEVSRVIDRYTQNEPGPTVIFMCGTHGNETSSVFAIKKVFQQLKENKPEIKGEMVAAYAGNLKALKEGVRYIDSDLNRGWIPKRLKRLGFFDESDETHGHEREERKEILNLLQQTFDQAKGDVFVFDLHTTSSPSPPFTAISDTIRNRKIALKFPLPCVVGFDEIIRGTFMNYINELGIMGVAYEAGEHYSLAAIENNISFIWHALAMIGSIKQELIPDYSTHYQNLCKENFGQRQIFDLVYRHAISEEDGFKMRPGYTTFDEIEKGEHIADDKNGPVKAQESGYIFMPLYQKQGDDGYFIVQKKSEEWLKLSEELRKARDDEYLKSRPGVSLHPDDDHTLIIEPKAYEEIRDRLHMMGFRRWMKRNGKIIITRREYDTESPDLKKIKVH